MNHLCNRNEDGSRPRTRFEMQRDSIESRIRSLCPSRKVSNDIMAKIDELCLIAFANRLGLKDQDIA